MATIGASVIALRKAWDVLGEAALYDKPREDSPHLISQLRRLGISVKMLTGDALPIAKEVASQAGIGNRISRITDLKNNLDNENILRTMDESDGFAEIYPEDKYRIVKLLQSRGYIVGMTGDGVNDSPALKQAESLDQKDREIASLTEQNKALTEAGQNNATTQAQYSQLQQNYNQLLESYNSLQMKTKTEILLTLFLVS
jgi:high-affinity K+ transport system ATPase subunit B